jgi:hypothetical protein
MSEIFPMAAGASTSVGDKRTCGERADGRQCLGRDEVVSHGQQTVPAMESILAAVTKK